LIWARNLGELPSSLSIFREILQCLGTSSTDYLHIYYGFLFNCRNEYTFQYDPQKIIKHTTVKIVVRFFYAVKLCF
jgi:hypothetical protein